MKTPFICTFLFLCIFGLSAQPAIQWQKCYGGSYPDVPTSIQQTTDGGYIAAGITISSDGDVIGNHGIPEIWVVKITATGSIQWKRALGGTSSDLAYCIRQTSDGGYVLVGSTICNDGDVSGNHGKYDVWVVKMKASGTIEWQKCLGGSENEEARCIRQTSDGGYILVGYTESTDGDVAGNTTLGINIWLVKINAYGAIEWQRTMGGTKEDSGVGVEQTPDGGYIIAANTESNDGDVSGNHGLPGSQDFWVVKVSNNGAVEWQKAYGGYGYETLETVSLANDGGYLLAGREQSDSSGQVTAFYGGQGDCWVVKLDSTGNMEWQKSFGGSEIDEALRIKQMNDGGYLVLAYTGSTDHDVIGNDGGLDLWLVKLNSQGEIVWQATYGGTGEDWASDLALTNDGGFVMAGSPSSNDGDVSGNHGEDDFWIVKFSPESVPVKDLPTQSSSLEIYPNPANDKITLNAPGETRLEIHVSDLMGRDILQQSISNGENLEVASLSDGLYIVTARTPDGKIYTNRFLK